MNMKVTLDNGEESVSSIYDSCIVSLFINKDGVLKYKTIFDGDCSLEQLLDLFSSASLEFYKTFCDKSGKSFSYENLMNNIITITKNSMDADDIKE